MTDQPEIQPGEEEMVFARAFWAMVEESDRLLARLDGELAKTGQCELAFSMLTSFVFTCGEKVIGRSGQMQDGRALDTAVTRTCSRLTSDCVGGWVLLRRGLVMPAVPVLRAALETTMQAIMFLERPETADQWLNGKQFKPSQVRDKSPTAAALYHSMYGRLSDHAHPNVVSALYHVVPLPEGEALLYGGWFAPKLVGLMLSEFARLELAFLRAFFRAYDSELKDLGLLFRPESAEVLAKLEAGPGDPPITWSLILDIHETMVNEAENAFIAMPDDQVAWARSVSPSLSGNNGPR